MARIRVLFDPSDDPPGPLFDPPVDPVLTPCFDLHVSPFDPSFDLGQMVNLTKRFLSSLSQNPRSKAQSQSQSQDQNHGQNDDLAQVNAKVKTDRTKVKTDPGFDAFWAAYPRHEKRLPAYKIWLRVVRTVAADTLIEAARKYRDDPNRLDEFTKHPTTWLNQNCWEDDPLPSRLSNGHGELPLGPTRDIGLRLPVDDL